MAVAPHAESLHPHPDNAGVLPCLENHRQAVGGADAGQRGALRIDGAVELHVERVVGVGSCLEARSRSHK